MSKKTGPHPSDFKNNYTAFNLKKKTSNPLLKAVILLITITLLIFKIHPHTSHSLTVVNCQLVSAVEIFVNTQPPCIKRVNRIHSFIINRKFYTGHKTTNRGIGRNELSVGLRPHNNIIIKN